MTITDLKSTFIFWLRVFALGVEFNGMDGHGLGSLWHCWLFWKDVFLSLALVFSAKMSGGALCGEIVRGFCCCPNLGEVMIFRGKLWYTALCFPHLFPVLCIFQIAKGGAALLLLAIPAITKRMSLWYAWALQAIAIHYIMYYNLRTSLTLIYCVLFDSRSDLSTTSTAERLTSTLTNKDTSFSDWPNSLLRGAFGEFANLMRRRVSKSNPDCKQLTPEILTPLQGACWWHLFSSCFSPSAF